MQNITKIIISILVIIVFVCASFLLYTWSHENNEEVPVHIASKQVALPQRITIPVIDIDTSVERVGVTTNGNMDTPKEVQNVGWYQYGTVPGESGSAVIAGHRDTQLGLPAVFWNLHKLKVGDEVSVTYDDGTEKTFVVTSTKTFPYNTKDTSEIFSKKGEVASLNLITCDGSWDKNIKNYNQRLVVFTKLKES